MASAAELWSLAGNPRDYIPSGTKQTSGTGSETTNQTTSQQQSQSTVVSKQNTPTSTIDAFQQLIAQLMDRPAISEGELNKQAPLPRYTDYPIYSSTSHNPDGSQAIAGYDWARYNKDLAVAQSKREKLIQDSGVIAGGTAEMKAQSGERKTEIQRNREQQGKYSKEAALSDAAGLNDRFSRQLLEQMMPQITRAVEGSGTTGGVVQGILAQDAAARVAEAQASLGLQTSAAYGNISNQLATVLESLTRETNPVMQALLQTLIGSKGTVEQGVTNTTSQGSQTTTGTVDKVSQAKETDIGNPKLPIAPAGFDIQALLRSIPFAKPVSDNRSGYLDTAVAGSQRERGFYL